MSMCKNMYNIYMCMYIYVCVCMCVCTYIYKNLDKNLKKSGLHGMYQELLKILDPQPLHSCNYIIERVPIFWI